MATGVIHAVFVFFEMDLAPGIKLSNNIGAGGHWGRTAFLLDRPIRTEMCDLLPITVNHDASQFSLAAGKAIAFDDDADQSSIEMKLASDDIGAAMAVRRPLFPCHATL